ncbi:unnamed protein product, partial [Gulo gulo]
ASHRGSPSSLSRRVEEETQEAPAAKPQVLRHGCEIARMVSNDHHLQPCTNSSFVLAVPLSSANLQ